MRLQSSGHRGDQVTLTSVLYTFKQPVSVHVDFRLEDLNPRTRSTLSVYILSKHRVPVRLQFSEGDMGWAEGWIGGCARIPRGTHHVMFLVTLGLPYHSDVYLDKIQFGAEHRCFSSISHPTGRLNLIVMACINLSTRRRSESAYIRQVNFLKLLYRVGREMVPR